MESSLAVSSYCQGCGAYLSFEKGKIKARARVVEDPFKDRPPQPKVEIDYRPRDDHHSKPSSPPPPPEPKKELSPPPTNNTSRRDPKEPKKPSLGFLTPKEPTHLKKRTAVCFECGDSHEANALANSTQCRKCGRLINMRSFEIRDVWETNLKTRGDVFVHKKALLATSLVECHDLTIEGEFTGNVICTGDLRLRRSAKILGQVIAKRLLIEKHAKIDFRNIIQTEQCCIDGEAIGNIVCSGELILEKKSKLTGDIKVGKLIIDPTAIHEGQVKMGNF